MTEVSKTNKQYSGLTNHGATCYMNSFLQTLFLTPQFRDQLFEWQYDEKIQEEQDCTPLQLQILFAKLHETKSKFYDTKPLIRSFQWPASEQFQQQDIQEFARLLFHTIEQSCDSTHFNDIYDGQIENFVHCNKCNQESIRIEHFQDLSMTVRSLFDNIQNNSLEKAIKYYIQPQELKGDNCYFCENCQDKQEAVKGSRFKILPQVLTFVLSRFELDLETFMRKKINHYMHYPFVLNMNKFFKNYDDIQAYDPSEEEIRQAQVKDQKVQNNGITPLFSDIVPKAAPKRKSSFDMTNKKDENDEINNGFKPKSKGFEFEDLQSLDKKQTGQKNNEDKNMSKAEEIENQRKEIFELKQYKEKLDKKQDGIIKKENSDNSNKKTSSQKGVSFSTNPALITGIDEIYEADECFDPLDPNFLSTATDVKIEDETTEDQEKISEEQKKKREEEREKKWQEILEAANKHQQEIQNLKEEYLKDGENVYELYAINIHTGGAMGGHYYSYIKSFENNQWNCFNDTNVYSISSSYIPNTFGEENPQFNSGQSAYMLAYRKVTGEQVKPRDPPGYIDQMLVKESEQLEKERLYKEQQKLEQKLIINPKVFYNGEYKIIDIKRNQQFSELLEQIKVEHNIQQEKENWRLRLYNQYETQMKDIYENDDPKITIEDIGIESGKTYIVETKTSDQVFKNFDPSSITLKVAKWIPNLISLDDQDINPVDFEIRPDQPLLDLMKMVEKEFNIPVNKQRLLKREFKKERKAQYISESEEDWNKLLKDYQLEYTTNIHLEEKQENTDANDENFKGLWEKEFLMDQTRLIISFNEPKVLKPKEKPEVPYKIAIDNQLTMNDLKKRIADYFDIDINTFYLKKNSFEGQFKNMKSKICENNYKNRGSIICALGQPCLEGEVQVNIVLAKQVLELSDQIQYEFKDIKDLSLFITDQDVSILELKKTIVEKIKKDDNLKIADLINPENIRLVEKNAQKMSRILHNSQKLSYYLRKNAYTQGFAAIILNDREESIIDETLLQIKFWNPKEFELSEAKEIWIERNSTYEKLGEMIAALYNQNISQLEFHCQYVNYVNFSKVSLIDVEKWDLFKDNFNVITESPYYLQDNSMMIVRSSDNSAVDMDKYKDRYGKPVQSKYYSVYSTDSSKTKKYVPEKAMKITIKKKEDPAQATNNSNSGNEEEEKKMENGQTSEIKTVNHVMQQQQQQQENGYEEQNDNNNGNSTTEDQNNQQQQQQQFQRKNERKLTSQDIKIITPEGVEFSPPPLNQITGENHIMENLIERLNSEFIDSQQIQEVINIEQKVMEKQSQVCWEVEFEILEETSLYFGKKFNIVLLFSENYLSGGLPKILIKQGIFHPNLKLVNNSLQLNNNLGIGDYDNYYKFSDESLVDESDGYGLSMVSILLIKFIQSIDNPNVLHHSYIQNRDAGRLYRDQDISNYNLSVVNSIKQIFQK